jgi:hypothetical protein
MIKNTFLHGFITGLLLPSLSFALLHYLNQALQDNYIIGSPDAPWIGFKDSTLALLSICSNLIPSSIANRRYFEDYIRGIMIPTVIGAFVWMFYFNALSF